MLINLTPHVINLIPGGEIPSSGVARCSQFEVVLDVIDGIKITKQTFGEVTGLPEPRDGVYYIVSKIVAQACPDRHDLLIPGPAVKGEDGRPIGCNGLSVI